MATRPPGSWRCSSPIRGRCVETDELEFADRLESALREESPARALETWAEIDGLLALDGPLRARVRDGVFARLLRVHPAAALVEAWPRCLPPLTHVLGRGSDTAEGRRHARRLVRDALLAGHGLEPLDFRHDPPLADLLAEDLGPCWLACLGAIRRLWSASALADALASFSTDPLPGTSGDAAREFWRCLCVADDPAAAEERRHDARRIMKRVQSDLHRQYMRRAGGPGLPFRRAIT